MEENKLETYTDEIVFSYYSFRPGNVRIVVEEVVTYPVEMRITKW